MQKGEPYLGVHDYPELMAIEGQGRGREGGKEGGKKGGRGRGREKGGKRKKGRRYLYSSMYIVCLPWHKRYYY